MRRGLLEKIEPYIEADAIRIIIPYEAYSSDVVGESERYPIGGRNRVNSVLN